MTGVVLALNLLMACVAKSTTVQIVASRSLLVPHGTIAELHVAVLPKKMMIQRSIQSLSLAQSHSQIQFLSLQTMIMCLAMTVQL